MGAWQCELFLQQVGQLSESVHVNVGVEKVINLFITKANCDKDCFER